MITIPISELEIFVLAANPATANTPIFFDDSRVIWEHARCIDRVSLDIQRADNAGFELRPAFDFSHTEMDGGSTCYDCQRGP